MFPLHKNKAYFGSEGLPKDDDANVFITCDLFEAAFCRAKGLKLTKIRHLDKKMVEVILEGKNAKEIAKGFRNNESVPVKDFIDLFKPLRDDVLRFRHES